MLEEREAARGNPAGLARGHLRTVHAHEARYDLKVDTSKVSAQELARTVLRAHSPAVAAGHYGGGPPP
ncbi:hypothetical protein ACFVZJ_02190 [Streptomyces sp. NPDC058322]|uniref:phosphotransferase-like protein n=1 Tax=Streptomyces sp. NPDC058322 TaxID=3346446 RepID=UPI0036E08D92